MPSSTDLSASVTGVRSGLVITCRSRALNRRLRRGVGVVGQHVGEPEVVGEVGRHGAQGKPCGVPDPRRTRSVVVVGPSDSRCLTRPRPRLDCHGDQRRAPPPPRRSTPSVVLVPLAALAVIAFVVPRWRWLARWPALRADRRAPPPRCCVATLTGEDLEETRGLDSPLMHDHEEWGERLHGR